MDLNATTSAAAPASYWKTGLLIFIAVLAISIPQAAILPLLDRDEPRFAEASREMLQSGNYVVPTFNNEPRYAKPPLIYWCQVASYRFFGENAFAARLPSLLATAGTAMLLFVWGVQLGSRCTGMIAALAYAFCLQTVQQGRVATADGLLIFFMTLTAFAGWKLMTIAHASHSTRSYFWDTIFSFGIAGGFLAKGPEALLPFVPFLFCARGIRRGLIAEGSINFALGLALVLFWAIPAYVETNGDYWRVGLSEGIGERMVSSLQGHGASSFIWYLLSVPLYYTLLFWPAALPWSPLFLTHRKKLFTGWKPDSVDTYLLLNAGLIFVVFSLMVTKLPHYTLPAFPFLALFLARRWITVDLSPVLPTQLCGFFAIAFAVLTLALIPVALAHHMTPSPTGELVRLAQAEGTLPADTQFGLVDFQEPSAVWEMRRVVRGYGKAMSNTDVISYMLQDGSRAVVMSKESWGRIRQTSHTGFYWKTYETRGWNTAKAWDSTKGTFATVDLVLVIKRQP